MPSDALNFWHSDKSGPIKEVEQWVFDELKKLKEAKRGNSFSTAVTPADIESGQSSLETELPSQLVKLYEEFGAPYLARGLDEEEAGGDNVAILTPKQISEVIRNQSPTMMPYPEGFNGLLPFAYLGDNHYLCVDGDNAVYGVGMTKIKDSLAEMMNLLAHNVTAYRGL